MFEALCVSRMNQTIRDIVFWLLRIDLFLIISVYMFFYILDIASEPAMKYSYSGNIIVVLVIGLIVIGFTFAISIFSTRLIKSYLNKIPFTLTVLVIPALIVPIVYFIWGLIRPCGEICF